MGVQVATELCWPSPVGESDHCFLLPCMDGSSAPSQPYWQYARKGIKAPLLPLDKAQISSLPSNGDATLLGELEQCWFLPTGRWTNSNLLTPVDSLEEKVRRLPFDPMDQGSRVENRLFNETTVIGKGTFQLVLGWKRMDINKKVICSVGSLFLNSSAIGDRLFLALFVFLFLLWNTDFWGTMSGIYGRQKENPLCWSSSPEAPKQLLPPFYLPESS